MSELRKARLLADNRLVRPQPAKAKPKAKTPPIVVKPAKVEPERITQNSGTVKLGKPLPAPKLPKNAGPPAPTAELSPTAEAPAAPVKKSGRSPSKIRTRVRHFVELTPRLRELAPAAFCTPPRPLALGITDELHPLVAGASRSAISHAVSLWCGRTIYLEALANGGARIALDGTECGQVSDEHRDSAKQRLAARQEADAAAFAAYRAKKQAAVAQRKRKQEEHQSPRNAAAPSVRQGRPETDGNH
jgi:sRNA-binding protein